MAARQVAAQPKILWCRQNIQTTETLTVNPRTEKKVGAASWIGTRARETSSPGSARWGLLDAHLNPTEIGLLRSHVFQTQYANRRDVDRKSSNREKGGRCLAEKYEGAGKKHPWECKLGHRFLMAPNNIRRSQAGYRFRAKREQLRNFFGTLT